MVMIRIRDHVARASSYEDGDVIYRLMAKELEAGAMVEVSFEGISSVPSAFVNASFVRLLESMPVAEVRSRLQISGSTRSINELLRSRLSFAATAAAHRS